MYEPRDPPPLELERWLLDEQTDAERARTEQRLSPERCTQLRHDDALLRERLFAALPPARFAARVRDRAALPARLRIRANWSLAASFAVACALLLIVRPDEVPAPTPQIAAPTERAKGGGALPALRIYRQRGEAVERLDAGATTATGDLLQLSIARAGRGYGALVSMDGRGSVTLHFPHDPAGDTTLPRDRSEFLLPNAYELDDAPHFECFVLVVSDAPIAVGDVLEAANRLARSPERVRTTPLTLWGSSSQQSFCVQK